MNGYLMTLSLINPKGFIREDGSVVDPIEYKTDEDIVFSGNSTNEAPSKYVLYKLGKDKQILNKILMLVSNECLDRRFSFIDNRNTYEYFIDKLKEFLDNDYHDMFPDLYDEIISRYESIDNYLKQIVIQIHVSSEPVEEEKNSIVDSLIRFIGEDENNRDLYVDFSGGSRISGMVALTIVRVFEKQFRTNIKEVIYANINGDIKTISNINDYYSSLKALEDNALDYIKGDYASKAQEKIGFKQSAEVKHINKVSQEIAEKSDKSYRKKEVKVVEKNLEQMKQKKVADPYAKELQKQYTIKVEEDIKKNPLARLLNKSINDIIVDFHELFIEILIDNKYIVPKKCDANRFEDEVKKQIKVNEYYYENSDVKKYWYHHGVLDSIVKWLDNKNINNYIDFWQKKKNIMSNEYKSFNPKYPDGINKKDSMLFMNYYYDNDIIIDGSEENLLKEYYRLSLVYYNYGFPFMSQIKGNCYSELMDYYLNRTEAFFNYLENHKHSDKEEVDALLQDIKNKKTDSVLLRNKIPLKIETNIWKINDNIFKDTDEAKEFIKKVTDRIEEVRPYRNAIAHKNNNEYSKKENKEKIVEKIKQWCLEYPEVD